MNKQRIRWLVCFFCIVCGAARSPSAAEPASQRLLLLVQGPDGHPAGTHEYIAGMEILAQHLQRESFELVTLRADEPWSDGPQQLEQADGAVLYLAEGAKWISADPQRLEAFRQLANRGGGLTCLHWAMGTREAQPIENFLQLFGGCHGGSDRKYQVLETTLSPTGEGPSQGAESFAVRDEFYYQLKFTADPQLTPVWKATIDGAEETVAWIWQRPDGGRSFGFSGAHFHENWQRDEYRQLVCRGILWTMRSEQ